MAKQVLAVLRGEPAMYAVNSPFIGAETFKVHRAVPAGGDAGSLPGHPAGNGPARSVEIEYLGELADLDVTPLKASVIRGLLAPVSEENVTLVNANMIAEQRGLRIAERKGGYEGIYKDLIRVHLTTSSRQDDRLRTVAHDGPHIVEINDFWVDVSPGEGYLLLCENLDTPGMVGRIGTLPGRPGHQHQLHARRPREGPRPGAHGHGPGRRAAGFAAGPDRRIPNIFSARTAKL